MYMIFWILQRIIISLVLILCAHYIYIFLKNNLTTPKTRDLVNQPREKYKEMYEKINQNIYGSSSGNNNNSNNNNNNNGNSSINSNNNQTKMKNELKNYLKDLKKSNDNGIGIGINTMKPAQSGVSDGSNSFNSALSDSGFSAY